MKVLFLLLVVIAVTGIAAQSATEHHHGPLLPRQTPAAKSSNSRQDASKTTTSHHESSSTSSAHPSPTKTNKSKPAGLKKPAKIGIAVGVPLGVVAIAGAIAAYIIGKRRGRKRRVDDPTAGANKLIKDPSDEINIPPTTPDVVELPTVRSQEFIGQIESSFTWWRPFARTKSTAKKGYAKPHDAPHSPQELPA